MSSILLTIITINYNNVQGLKKTIDSVKSQNYSPIEYIIIDGGSNDGSKELIEANVKLFDNWISEKDNGIYHAMNKGIKKATGEYLLFLNSGDYFNSSDSLEELFADCHHEDIIYGDLLMYSNSGTWLKKHPSILNFEYFLNDCLPHSASLIKRNLFDRVGLYNEHYKILSDWEFFMNAVCLHSCTYRYVPFPTAVFCQDGISSDPKSNSLIEREKKQILSNNYSAFLSDYRKLDQYRSDLNNILNSRLHRLLDKILKSFFIKKIKNIFSKNQS
jgi:glycosyltransferase involved in cell wall biosynthesis